MNRLSCPVCSEGPQTPATSPSPCSCSGSGSMFPSRHQLIKNTTPADLMTETDRSDPGSEKRKRSMQALKRPRSWTETGSSLCCKHNSSLVFYCCTDEQIICEVCASAEHIGHTIGSVKGERRRKQEELKNTAVKSKQILQKQEKKWNNLEKTVKQIQEEARNTVDYCESILASIMDSLQRHFLSVRELIGAQEEVAASQVQLSLQTLQVKIEGMRKRSAELERLAQTDDDIHFLKKWPSLQRLCEKDHRHPLRVVSEDPLLPFELTKRAVDELGKQLEEFCDRKFASISQTADTGEQQESEEETEEDDMQQRCEASTSQSHGLPGVNKPLTVEPKTRADFLQYACSLSLDPATAHKDLVISVGNTEVKLSPHKRKIPAVHHPEQFIHRRQLLCREGLQAERCYYEIEVEGDKAEIALTYKGIDRKSRMPLSAFGGNAYSWSLDRSTNYSVSHRGDSIQLTTSPSHPRIGVYLEFKEGMLSFYEVSDGMKFLYKVEAEFTEPLYPGFWLGEKCCIKICDLSSR